MSEFQAFDIDQNSAHHPINNRNQVVVGVGVVGFNFVVEVEVSKE